MTSSLAAQSGPPAQSDRTRPRRALVTPAGLGLGRINVVLGGKVQGKTAGRQKCRPAQTIKVLELTYLLKQEGSLANWVGLLPNRTASRDLASRDNVWSEDQSSIWTVDGGYGHMICRTTWMHHVYGLTETGSAMEMCDAHC